MKNEPKDLIAFVKTFLPDLEEMPSAEILKFISLIKKPKGTKLFSEGKRHSNFYFIIKGTAKSYYLKDGKEVCLWFAFENDTLGSIMTYNGEPSNETIELLEDSELICYKSDALKRLAKENLAVSNLSYKMLEEHALFLEYRLQQLLFMSSKERYENLLKAAPEVFQRVSLTDIASYLGVSRETLSRIRKQG